MKTYKQIQTQLKETDQDIDNDKGNGQTNKKLDQGQFFKKC